MILATSGPVSGLGVLLAPSDPQIDGGLGEWGDAVRIGLVPGGPGVSVRGDFKSEVDLEADVYLLWDAAFLYVAAMVRDDVADIHQILPQHRIWEGDGKRLDRMLYYDHMRVFIQDRDKSLGYDIWLSPETDAEPTFFWGGRQRQADRTDLPVAVGGAGGEGIYALELAIPWKWMEIHPRPNMQLEAMFLFVDADEPDLPMAEKSMQRSSYLLWRGQIHLVGDPEGLELPPPSVIERIEEAISSQSVPSIAPVAESTVSDNIPSAISNIASGLTFSGKSRLESLKVTKSKAPSLSAVDPTEICADSLTPRSSVIDRSRDWKEPLVALQRQPLADRDTQPPSWVRQLAPGQGLQPSQADALFVGLAKTLHRLLSRRIDGRSDIIVVDMGAYAQVRRVSARVFLTALMDRIARGVVAPEHLLRTKLSAAAEEKGIAVERAVKLVVALCAEATDVYIEGRVVTTGHLVERAANRADVTVDMVRELGLSILTKWSEL